MRASGLISARVVAVIMAWASAESAAADILRVPEDYPTIQAAIDAAAETGDIILVAPGTYSEYLELVKKSVTIRSSEGLDVTILDGGGTGVGLLTDSTTGFTVEGFTFRRLDSAIRTLSGVGDPSSIRHCLFESCNQSAARLSAFDSGTVFVEDCMFIENGGAGISYGGDISELYVRDSAFERNGNGGARLSGSGGGDPSATFDRCIFRANIAASGAGILANNCLLVVDQCVFEGNVASDAGGAIYWQDYITLIGMSTFRDNVAGAAGGAIAARNSMFGNEGGSLSECIVQGNNAPVGSQIALLRGQEDLTDVLSVECSVVEGGAAAVHVEKEWTLIWDDSSNLQDMQVAFGTLITSGILKLTCSDDRAVRVRSQPGFAASEPNIVDLRVGAISPQQSPQFIDLTFEGRLNQPGGSGRLRLRNWTTGNLFRVRDFSIGSTEITEEVEGIDPANFMRASDGRIEVSIFESVIATFSASGFDSFTDWVQVAVR